MVDRKHVGRGRILAGGSVVRYLGVELAHGYGQSEAIGQVRHPHCESGFRGVTAGLLQAALPSLSTAAGIPSCSRTVLIAG